MKAIRHYVKDESGAVAIEFYMLLPIMLLIFFATIEISRFILMQQKVDGATHAIVDIINQQNQITAEMIDALIETVPEMVAPFDSEGVDVFVTSARVKRGEIDPITLWQCGGGTASSNQSRISSGEGDVPNLPQLELEELEQIIAVELFMQYRPLMDNGIVRRILSLQETGVYKVSIARPRFGSFEFAPNC